MGTIKRLNDAQQRLQDAENAMPGAYDDQYAQGIADTLDKMGTAGGAGFDFTTADSGYKDALTRMVGNANAGADAAAATADALSGGYGADYAKSAADQAAAAQTANTGSTLAAARADALAQWQQELAGAGDQLDTLLGQRALERGEYDSSVSNAANWRNYLYDRTQQARQENSDFWNNVWNAVKGIGSTVMEGYDAYKGYSQQKLENQIAGYQMAAESFDAGDPERAKQICDLYGLDSSMVDKWTESYATRQNKASSIQTAIGQLKAGSPEAARETLRLSGLDETLLDNWQGMTDYEKDQLDATLNAMSAAGSGNDTGANTILKLAGLDENAIDYYGTIANRQNQSKLSYAASQLALNNRYKTTGSGSSRTSSTKSGNTSSGSGKTGTTGFTNSQLQTMAKEFSGMKETDPLYDFYQQTLTEAGWLKNSTAGSNGTSGRANTRSSPLRSGLATARGMLASGYSLDDIAGRLSADGITDNTLSSIMKILEAER